MTCFFVGRDGVRQGILQPLGAGAAYTAVIDTALAFKYASMASGPPSLP